MSASGVSLVVTGFGVFADVLDNPSMRIVEELSSNGFACEGFAESVQFKILEVSVDGCSSFHDGSQCTENERMSSATVFVHIGVNSKGTHINLEECAYNNMTFRVPDVKGFQPESATIESESPLDQPLYSSLHLIQMCQALNQIAPALPGREDVNLVQLSQDPGRYLCNYVYYQALSHHKSQQKPMLSVFVHVPPFEVISQDVQVDMVKQLLILIAKNAADQKFCDRNCLAVFNEVKENQQIRQICCSMSVSDEAYKAFIANSNLHMWGLNDGVRLFIRCALDANTVRGEDWPRATLKDKVWTVNCGMWIQNEDTTFRLVALWATLGEGLTKLFALPEYKESASLILDLTGGGEAGPAGENQLVDPRCYDAFLCMLGEEVVESLNCPVLEAGSPVEAKE